MAFQLRRQEIGYAVAAAGLAVALFAPDSSAVAAILLVAGLALAFA